jgi:hypothetical protein
MDRFRLDLRKGLSESEEEKSSIPAADIPGDGSEEIAIFAEMRVRCGGDCVAGRVRKVGGMSFTISVKQELQKGNYGSGM